MMFKFFKRKHLVPVDEHLFEQLGKIYFNRVDNFKSLGFYDWIEKEYGVKRQFKWSTEKNYLVFDSEKEFIWFMFKL